MVWLWRRLPHLATVVVNLKTPDATTGAEGIGGALVDDRGPWLILRGASLVGPQGTARVEGEVFIPRANVAFVQVPPV